jgi:hypothetical protein
MELINTLETPGEFDALANLRPDEPYFLLIGRDRLAPDLVQKWADENRKRTLREFEDGHITEERREAELRKSTQAEAIGWGMKAYKAGRRAEVLVSGEKETYTGHKLDEETLRRDRLQSQKAASVSAIHNAIAETTDLVAMLDETQADDADLANVIREVLADMRDIADKLTPRRPGAK